MKDLIQKHKIHWRKKDFLISSFFALMFLAGSLVINFYAGQYATERASNAVTDIILSNTPVFDLDGIFVYGFVAFLVFVGCLCVVEPKRIPFTLKSLALFVVIRSLFISLTHIGPFSTTALINSAIVKRFTFDGDLFFSAHTGIPFLMALIFWDTVYLRLLFIMSSVFFGIVVLLAHLHYSIDVLSAFFITYTIYHIAEHIFKKDREIFVSGIR